MTGADGDAAGRHLITLALAHVAAALDGGLTASTVGMTQSQARGLLMGLEVQERRMHALRLRLIGESVAHDRTVPSDDPRAGCDAGGVTRRRPAGVGTAAWMRTALKVSGARAGTEVRAATLLDPQDGDLRELGAALAAGDTSAEHVKVGCRVMARIRGTCGSPDGRSWRWR